MKFAVFFLASAALAQNAGDGMTPLHGAASRDDLNAVRQLLAAGADVKAATRIQSLTCFSTTCPVEAHRSAIL